MKADSLKREFLPRFKALAATRIARVRGVAIAPTATTCEEVVRELHALAGEAGLLGLETVLAAAREAELHAAELAGAPSDRALRERLIEALDALDRSARGEEAPAPPASAQDKVRATPPAQDKFRATFMTTAEQRRARIDRTKEGTETWFVVSAQELKPLHGEALMLGMAEIADICRDGAEAAIRRDRGALAGALTQLEVALFAEDVPRGSS